MIDKNVVIISDDNYLVGSCVLIKSILDNSDTKDYVFYIVHDFDKMSLTTKNSFKQLFPNNKIVFCVSSKYESFKKDMELKYKEDYVNKKWNTSIWLQAFLSDAVPDSVDTAVYMDSDTFFLRSPEIVFNFDLKSPLAGQIDYGSGNYNEHFQYPYFNAGFFATSLKYWRDSNLVDIFLEKIKTTEYKFHVQDFLNEFFRNNWQLFGPQINVAREAVALQSYLRNKNDICNPDNFTFYLSPVNIHFLGSPKPWSNEYILEYKDNWRLFNSIGEIEKIYFNLISDIKNSLNILKRKIFILGDSHAAFISCDPIADLQHKIKLPEKGVEGAYAQVVDDTYVRCIWQYGKLAYHVSIENVEELIVPYQYEVDEYSVFIVALGSIDAKEFLEKYNNYDEVISRYIDVCISSISKYTKNIIFMSTVLDKKHSSKIIKFEEVLYKKCKEKGISEPIILLENCIPRDYQPADDLDHLNNEDSKKALNYIIENVRSRYE